MAMTNTASSFPYDPPSALGQADLPGTQSPAAAPAAAPTDLMGRVVQGAHETIDRLAEHAAPQLAKLGDNLASAGDAVHGKADAWRATGDEWAESLRCTVRDNPLAAVAAAVALGVVIARVTR